MTGSFRRERGFGSTKPQTVLLMLPTECGATSRTIATRLKTQKQSDDRQTGVFVGNRFTSCFPFQRHNRRGNLLRTALAEMTAITRESPTNRASVRMPIVRSTATAEFTSIVVTIRTNSQMPGPTRRPGQGRPPRIGGDHGSGCDNGRNRRFRFRASMARASKVVISSVCSRIRENSDRGTDRPNSHEFGYRLDSSVFSTLEALASMASGIVQEG